jgi:hypothetical protein
LTIFASIVADGPVFLVVLVVVMGSMVMIMVIVVMMLMMWHRIEMFAVAKLW